MDVSWTIKKAEHQRIDAFELWCWRRFLRVPWTASRSNQSILKENSPGCSLKDWCWSWNSHPLATWCKELTHLKRPWCWERLKVGREGDDRGWDGCMASPTQWRWVWVDSGSWWWTERPGVLWSMGSQRVRHDWATELYWTEWYTCEHINLGKYMFFKARCLVFQKVSCIVFWYCKSPAGSSSLFHTNLLHSYPTITCEYNFSQHIPLPTVSYKISLSSYHITFCLQIGTCHLPLHGLNYEPLQLPTFNTPWKEFRVEIRNEALWILGKTGRPGLQIVRYFQKKILWVQFLYLLISRRAVTSFMVKTAHHDKY